MVFIMDVTESHLFENKIALDEVLSVLLLLSKLAYASVDHICEFLFSNC